MTFSSYLEERRENASEMSKTFFDIIELNEIEHLGAYIDYILRLKPENITSEALLDVYRRFSDCIVMKIESKNLSSFTMDAFTLNSILIPFLRWKEHSAASECALEIIRELERAINAVTEILCSEFFEPDVVELQNQLIFCYFVIAMVSKIGVDSTVFRSHLSVHRHMRPGRWIAIPSRVRIQYATLLLHISLQFYKVEEEFKTKFGFSMNVLADLRSMFDDAAGASFNSPLASHQWVFRWFRDKLDADVFSIRNTTTALSSLAVLSDSQQSLAIGLCRRFSSYRLPVTINHMERFLSQFGTTQRINGALQLLNHLKFYPLWELGDAIEKQLSAELEKTNAPYLVVATLGEQTGSTSIIKYLASHSKLEGRLRFTEDLQSAFAITTNEDSIYFIDDCLLSGTQTLNILGELMGTRKLKNHHTHHCNKLNEEDKKKFLSRSLRFVYCIATDIGEQRFHDGIKKIGIDSNRVKLQYAILEHSTAKAFEPLGPVGWTSAEEKIEMKRFCAEVGYNLLAHRGKIKKWDDIRRKESALGYSDFQRLIVFPYNVPKTTITLLWESGTADFPWQPLFPGFG